MPQGEDLGQHSGVAADQQPHSTHEPDHHQVQQSNQHTDDRYREPENPSSPHVRQVLARYSLPPVRRTALRRPPRTHPIQPAPGPPRHCLQSPSHCGRSPTHSGAIGTTGRQARHGADDVGGPGEIFAATPIGVLAGPRQHRDHAVGVGHGGVSAAVITEIPAAGAAGHRPIIGRSRLGTGTHMPPS